MRLRRTRLVPALAVAAVLTVPLAGCGTSSAGPDSATEGTVTILGYAGVFQDNYEKAVIEPFQKANPKIKVTFRPAQNSAEMLATLRSEKSNPSNDVAIMDTSVSATGNKEGIFAPLDPKAVPNVADVTEQGKTPKNFGPAVTYDNLVLLYDTTKVKPAPTSWDALWDPKHKGKIGIPAAPDIQGLALTMIVCKMEGADYQKTIDPAVERLSQLSGAVQTWDPQPDPYSLVTSGSATVAVGWNARGQLYADTSKGKLGVALPSEGSVFQVNTINLTKNSKHPKAAQAFMDYALSPKAQESFTETMFYAPTNSKAKVPAAAADRTATSPERQKEMISVDWNWIAERRDAWTEEWRRKVIGG
ncbi:MAG: extracellular solute-binding protein [Streptosporangiales bacterium]|nr:extracellular solute-binding protein [Streptosporangiales bacterium]